MELAEKIDTINRQLREEFGADAVTFNPMWRVVWSEDQFEQYIDEHGRRGTRPKYRQWIKEKYVLENLVLTPEGTDLTTKVSYEPKWAFEDSKGRYLPPKYEVAKFIIELVMVAMGKPVVVHKDPEADPEKKKANFEEFYQSMFGNETSIGDALAHKYGVAINNTDMMEKPS